jgi:hypothetical protein
MTMKHSVITLVAVAVTLVLSFSCVSNDGQLTAEEVYPNVKVVTQDLEEYLDAGIAPDGGELTPEAIFKRRGSIVTLRNAFHEAMGQPREVLPTLPMPGGAETSNGEGDDGSGAR